MRDERKLITMDSKKGKTLKGVVIAGVIGIFLVSIFLFIEFVNGQGTATVLNPYPNNSLEQPILYGTKYSNFSNVLISSPSIISCNWKPSSSDDGYKSCETIFTIENKNPFLQWIGVVTINPTLFNFTFQKGNTRSGISLTFSDDYVIKNYTYGDNLENISNGSMNSVIIQKKDFYNFTSSSINVSKPFAIKVNFEIPKYADNQFNLGIPILNSFLDPNVSACGTLSTPNTVYNMNQSINGVSTTCIVIGDNNITLNMNGYSINGTNATGTKGISKALGINGSTVRNGTISNFQYGVYYLGQAYNDTLSYINSTNNYGAGFYIASFNVNANNLLANNNSIDGIYFESGSTSENFTNITTNYNSNSGIKFWDSHHNIVSYLTSRFNIYGLTFDGTAGVNGGLNITVSNSDFSNNTYGIIFYRGNNNYLNNVAMNSTGSTGILFTNSAKNNENNTFNNITIRDSLEGIWLNGNTNINNTFINSNVYTSNQYGVYMYNPTYSSTNTIFQNINISGSTTSDVRVSANSYQTIFLNSTYSTEQVASNGQLFRKWYFDAQANYTHNSSAAPNTNVTAYNLTGSYEFSALTGSNGKMPTQSLVQYINVGGTTTYQNNHTINATLVDFGTSSYLVNITTNSLLQINVSDTTSPTINIIFPPVSHTFGTNVSLPLNYSITENGVGVSSCWYYVLNSTNSYEISNRTIPSCLNISFNVSTSGTYNAFIYSNDTNNNVGFNNITFLVSLALPAVNINAPINNQYFNNGTNIYINFTASRTIGLDTAQLFINGVINYTWIEPGNFTMNWTTINLSEGTYNINVKVNDTANNIGWASSNNTFYVDFTFPNISINSISTTIGSLIVSFNSTEVDNFQMSKCWYSVFNSVGLVDGSLNNISYTCGTGGVHSFIVSNFGTYNLTIYGNDSASNLNSTTGSFTTTSSSPPSPPGGGGGGPQPEEVVTKSFCGDNICQLNGNGYGLLENQYNCPVDCPLGGGFNIDDFFIQWFFNCFNNDPTKICAWRSLFQGQGVFSISNPGANFTTANMTKTLPFNGDTAFLNCIQGKKDCFWETSVGVIILFSGIALIAALFLIKIPYEKGGSKKGRINQYVLYKAKKIKKRR